MHEVKLYSNGYFCKPCERGPEKTTYIFVTRNTTIGELIEFVGIHHARRFLCELPVVSKN